MAEPLTEHAGLVLLESLKRKATERFKGAFSEVYALEKALEAAYKTDLSRPEDRESLAALFQRMGKPLQPSDLLGWELVRVDRDELEKAYGVRIHTVVLHVPREKWENLQQIFEKPAGVEGFLITPAEIPYGGGPFALLGISLYKKGELANMHEELHSAFWRYRTPYNVPSPDTWKEWVEWHILGELNSYRADVKAGSVAWEKVSQNLKTHYIPSYLDSLRRRRDVWREESREVLQGLWAEVERFNGELLKEGGIIDRAIAAMQLLQRHFPEKMITYILLTSSLQELTTWLDKPAKEIETYSLRDVLPEEAFAFPRPPETKVAPPAQIPESPEQIVRELFRISAEYRKTPLHLSGELQVQRERIMARINPGISEAREIVMPEEVLQALLSLGKRGEEVPALVEGVVKGNAFFASAVVEVRTSAARFAGYVAEEEDFIPKMVSAVNRRKNFVWFHTHPPIDVEHSGPDKDRLRDFATSIGMIGSAAEKVHPWVAAQYLGGDLGWYYLPILIFRGNREIDREELLKKYGPAIADYTSLIKQYGDDTAGPLSNLVLSKIKAQALQPELQKAAPPEAPAVAAMLKEKEDIRDLLTNSRWLGLEVELRATVIGLKPMTLAAISKADYARLKPALDLLNTTHVGVFFGREVSENQVHIYIYNKITAPFFVERHAAFFRERGLYVGRNFEVLLSELAELGKRSGGEDPRYAQALGLLLGYPEKDAVHYSEAQTDIQWGGHPWKAWGDIAASQQVAARYDRAAAAVLKKIQESRDILKTIDLFTKLPELIGGETVAAAPPMIPPPAAPSFPVPEPVEPDLFLVFRGLGEIEDPETRRMFGVDEILRVLRSEGLLSRALFTERLTGKFPGRPEKTGAEFESNLKGPLYFAKVYNEDIKSPGGLKLIAFTNSFKWAATFGPIVVEVVVPTVGSVLERPGAERGRFGEIIGASEIVNLQLTGGPPVLLIHSRLEAEEAEEFISRWSRFDLKYIRGWWIRTDKGWSYEENPKFFLVAKPERPPREILMGPPPGAPPAEPQAFHEALGQLRSRAGEPGVTKEQLSPLLRKLMDLLEKEYREERLSARDAAKLVKKFRQEFGAWF